MVNFSWMNIHTYFLCVKVRVLVFVSNYICFRIFLGAVLPFDSLVLISFYFVGCAALKPNTPHIELGASTTTNGRQGLLFVMSSFHSHLLFQLCNLVILFLSRCVNQDFIDCILQFASRNLTAPCNLTSILLFRLQGLFEDIHARAWLLPSLRTLSNRFCQRCPDPKCGSSEVKKNCVECRRCPQYSSLSPRLRFTLSWQNSVHVTLVGVTPCVLRLGSVALSQDDCQENAMKWIKSSGNWSWIGDANRLFSRFPQCLRGRRCMLRFLTFILKKSPLHRVIVLQNSAVRMEKASSNYWNVS